VHAITAEDVARLDLAMGITGTASDRPTRVGFVVSKAVGNSVIRHRVTRRLRHLLRDRLGTLPSGCTLVVRALPPAAAAASAELGGDIDSALRKLRLAGTEPGGVMASNLLSTTGERAVNRTSGERDSETLGGGPVNESTLGDREGCRDSHP
jgi:ribonuclease P protein component